ncbi:MAG: glycosyltransferase [Methanolobus sp.]|nr:glycosyltransferase [Methanolobus sp.]
MDDVSFVDISGKVRDGEMTRVLMCGPIAKAGGVSAHTINLTNSLLKAGSTVIPYSFLGDSEKELEPSEVNAFRKTYYRTLGLIIESYRKRSEYDIIHIQTSGGIFSFISSISGIAAAKILNKHSVVTFHFSWIDFYKRYHGIISFVIQNCDTFVTVSERNKRLLLDYVADNCASKIKVIPNGYDDSLFKPLSKEDSKKKLQIPSESIVIVSIGNLLPHKGHKNLIEAVSILKQKFQRDNLLCYIVGNGPSYNELESLIKEHSLEDSVILTGRVKWDELPLYLNSSELLIFPSFLDGESFGIVQIEAMGCGKPVVATRNGGSEEIVISEDYGLLVEPGDSQELAEKIKVALDKKWDEGMILSHVRQYQWENIAEQIKHVYSTAPSR